MVLSSTEIRAYLGINSNNVKVLRVLGYAKLQGVCVHIAVSR